MNRERFVSHLGSLLSEPQSLSSQALQAQLVASLTFHHSKILSEMSLEVALSAMTQAWQSCQESKDRGWQLTESLGETVICDPPEGCDWDPPFESERSGDST